jgi:bla regulator protein BlaR1
MMLKPFFDVGVGIAHMGALLADHLWQSTLFAVEAGAATLALRGNQARVRYGLWLAASMKFLIPFSLLVDLGKLIGGLLIRVHDSATVQTGFYTVVEQVSQPFSSAVPVARTTNAALLLSLLPTILLVVWLCGAVSVFGLWWLRWRRVSAVARTAVPMTQGREVDALRRVERIAGLRRPILLMVWRVATDVIDVTGAMESTGSLEPGIFGVARPVLLWPPGISEHLDDAQLSAILAPEVWHVRRRDNLAAALHMLVEAVFWFHPLVWWLGARLVEERERACDEEVLRLGSAPEVYAESILKACRFCVESPLKCVSGVSGSNLKRRIVQIMNPQLANQLTLGRKVFLASMAIAAISGPVVFGLFNPARMLAQPMQASGGAQPTFEPTFEQASIKPSHTADKISHLETRPDGLTDSNVTVRELIEYAYGVQSYQIASVEDWIDSERFDVEVKFKPSTTAQVKVFTVSPDPLPPASGEPALHAKPAVLLPPGQLQVVLKALLADRFHLQLKHESRDQPVYDLVVGTSGAKLTESKSTPTAPNGEAIISVRQRIGNGAGELTMNGPVSALTGFLSQQLSREVVDKTGLKGTYAVKLQWKTNQSATDSITAALQEQLGLNLESQQGPVEMLTIEQIEKPSED